MTAIRDWKKEVSNLRKSAETFRTFDNDAALMRCRKSMEAIQYSIFEEINGELPTTYLPFEKMMGNKGIGLHIPKPVEIDFQTVHQWGNYGCHFQDDGEPNESQVESALSALDSLIEWRFDDEKTNRNLAASAKSTKPLNKELLIKLPFFAGKKRYNVNNLLKYLATVETHKPKHTHHTHKHKKATTARLELARAEPNAFRVHRLNRSATLSIDTLLHSARQRYLYCAPKPKSTLYLPASSPAAATSE